MTPNSQAAASEQVAVIAKLARNIPTLMDAARAASIPDAIRRARTTPGAQRIDYKSGGSIHYLSERSAERLRGRTLHCAWVTDLDILEDENFRSHVIPCFATTGEPRFELLP